MDVAQKKYTKGKSTEIADEKNFNFGTVQKQTTVFQPSFQNIDDTFDDYTD